MFVVTAEPPANPSSPSVTFTAFVVAKMIVPARSTHSTGPRSRPGRSARVSDTLGSMSVVTTSTVTMPSDIRYDTEP